MCSTLAPSEIYWFIATTLITQLLHFPDISPYISGIEIIEIAGCSLLFFLFILCLMVSTYLKHLKLYSSEFFYKLNGYWSELVVSLTTHKKQAKKQWVLSQ